MFTYLFERDYSVAISRLMLLTLVAVLPFMGGCGEDENPILDDDHAHDHEVDAPLHADADGFNLEVDGTLVYHQHQGAHEGGLTVDVGEEIEVHVVFIDAHEEEVHLDEVVPPPGEDGHDDPGHDEHDHDGAEAFSLGLTGYDSSIIEIHLHEEEEDDDDHDHEEDDDHDHEGEEHNHEEDLHFAVVGLKAGETEIKLQLLHGDHPDFTAALPIPVTVK